MAGSKPTRYLDLFLITLMVILTLSTAYIHYWVGGMMLMLNALGYLGLVVLTIGSFILVRRALPLVLMMLAAYAAVTILGWLVMGPYFDVAYVAKAIELVLIGTIAFYLVRNRDDVRDSFAWLREMLNKVTGRSKSAAATPAGPTEE